VGEFRILRENSFDEAMTMKLAERWVQVVDNKMSKNEHIEDTNGTESTGIPLFLVTFHGGRH
jgi:hypothetical protein